jgi:CheY-like chemotaxis protein
MVKSFIDDLDDEFVECGDGSQALDAYTQQHPDLVLMDIKMS